MSVESKQVERYRNTLEEINTFEYKHKDSDYQKQVDNYRKLSKKALSLQD